MIDSTKALRLIDCTRTEHGQAILDILNDAIVSSTALYDYEPRTLQSMDAWFATKVAGNYPVIGAVTPAGVLAGFASFGTFRNFPAYKYTVEHSVYVHRDFRGMGIGELLLKSLIEAAANRDLHAMIGAIDADNSASVHLHEKFGFVRVGTLPQVGFKFGRWLDLALYQLALETPANPSDG